MLYEERSPHQHHTIDGPLNVKDIVGASQVIPRRWCLHEAGWRSVTPRFQTVLNPRREGQDRWDLTNRAQPYSISLTNMDPTGQPCEPSRPSAVSCWRGRGNRG